MIEDDQTVSAFSAPNRRDAFLKARSEAPKQKGLSYADLLIDNIVGLDNDYESFGEAFGKSFNEDELGTLKNMAVSAYEGAKEFVTSPIETSKDIATEISDSVSRLGTESLDGRLKRMYGIGYQDATEEQVTRAREAVIGDAVVASSLIPAAKGATTVAKAAIPGKIQADVVGQMRSLVDGDKEFRTESKNPPVGLSADVVGSPYKPKMFSSGEVGLSPSNYSVAEFYSPTVETLRNTEFPSKGYKGSELLKLLKDKTPGVRKAELDAMDLGIDPQQRYTKEDVLGLAEKRSYKVTAQEVDDPQFKDIQRQNIKDQEVGYATLKINATPNSEDVQPFLPIRGYTHYDPETIAHTRVSIREGQDGAEYLLVEEIQSDLIQHGSVKPRGPITVDDAYEEVLDLLAEDISKDYPDLKTDYETNQRYFDNLFKVGAENSRQYRLREQGFSVPQEELDAYEKLVDETRDLATQVGDASYSPGFSKLSTMMENAGYEEGYRIDRRTGATGLSPLTEDSDAVRLALQTAMAKASDSDVTSLVIPNIQRIITADRARFGSAEYEKYMKPSSGFQRTYVKGVEKFIKQLQSEYGDSVKVSTVELPYVKEKLYSGGEGVDVPKTALKIDFGDLKDVNLRVGRFAEGGMVEDDQMNRLMQEGGMADDGMDREPITGNEIPPGSLASEVRDDIPAQLSEGEYVVPADVLRYYGVRFFEELRAQAKQGMMEMESDGRIGGTPVDSQGVPMEGQDEELTPEEEQMLREALGASGMAYGGMVQQPMTTPYQDQATMYQAPKGMQEGGMTETPFDRTQFSMGQTGSGIETRKYINPKTKEVRSFNFIGNTPLGLVPPDFVPWTQELQDQVAEAPVDTSTSTQNDQRGGDRGRDGDNQGQQGNSYGDWARENYADMMSDPFSVGMRELNSVSEQGLLGSVGIIGLANDAKTLDKLSKANAALSRLDPQSAQARDLQAAIDATASKLNSPIAKGLYSLDIVAQGKQINSAVDAVAGAGKTTTTAGTGTGRTVSTGSTGGNRVSVGYGEGKVDPGLAAAAAAAGKDKGKDKSVSVGYGEGKVDPGLASAAAGKDKEKDKAVSGGQAASNRSGGAFAPGGLVTKPKKTAHSKKGLAS
jgi:hypothetical protein